MLQLITRGIKSIVNVAKKIGQRIKGNSRNAEIREEEEEPEKRTYVVTAVRDSKTCKLCLSKDGTRFTVSPNDSVETIAGRLNSVPPFHIRCRCMLNAD